MGCGRARVCVAPGHGLVVRLDDPDCGRAPPGLGRGLPRIDIHRGSDWEVARRAEHHALRIRLESATGSNGDGEAAGRRRGLGIPTERADPIRVRGERPGAGADLHLGVRERSRERPGGQDGEPGDQRGH